MPNEKIHLKLCIKKLKELKSLGHVKLDKFLLDCILHEELIRILLAVLL